MPPMDDSENEMNPEEQKEEKEKEEEENKVTENPNGVENQFKSFYITEEQRKALDEVFAEENRMIGPERRIRRSIDDDFIKIIRNQDLSPEAIATIRIPVPKALEVDPHFRPLPEVQIVQMMIEESTSGEINIGKCMIQLCKQLAEKRVFGPRLMSLTTTAGLNHSLYSNLPIRGICYMQNVCWKVLRRKCTDDEDFWEKFRVSMQTVAARCRRIRQTQRNRFEEQLQRMGRSTGSAPTPYSCSSVLFSFPISDFGTRIRPQGQGIPQQPNSLLLEQLVQALQNKAPNNEESERSAEEARPQASEEKVEGEEEEKVEEKNEEEEVQKEE